MKRWLFAVLVILAAAALLLPAQGLMAQSSASFALSNGGFSATAGHVASGSFAADGVVGGMAAGPMRSTSFGIEAGFVEDPVGTLVEDPVRNLLKSFFPLIVKGFATGW